MIKNLQTFLKSPTRVPRAKNGFVKNRILPFLFLMGAMLGFQQNAIAQTTTITTAGTGFDAANGLTGNSFITFVVQNTNTYDVILTGVDNFWKTGNTGTVPSLWYTTTALSGPITAPGIATPTWTNITTGTALTVTANGFMPSFTNLNFVIPAGAQYRFALVSTNGISYSGSGAGTPNPNTFTSGGVSLKVHDAKVASQDVGYSGAFPTSTNSPRSFTGQIHFQPATPCVAPPTGGQAVSTVATVCPNTSFNLSLTGASGGQGMTYQWQSSANGTSGWTNVTGLTNANVTTSQTATTFYRAVLTCSGQTANSLPVQVTTNATPVSGTFTINKGNPASATNFQSFTAAIASIECGGANGPIVFNVAAGSGPYNEQVTIPVIPGTSATNTVTFNGNGNTLRGTSTAGVPALKLDGADFIRINNLTIESEATATAGQVMHLTNGADNNIFNGNTINHVGSLGSTSTSYAVYIHTGSNNNNMFQNNTIIGGYYGIYNYGAAAATQANNSFIGNTIKDFYYYGSYNYYAPGTMFEGNDISRPTRTNAGFMYAIYVTTGSTGMTISKNRIHNTHDAATTTSGTVYGIYVGTAGTLGTETIIKNNVLYNINANGGSFYGLYNSGGNNTYYFHNTVSADMPGVSYSTLRGMYFLSASTNVKFQNNNISLGSNATTKHAIYAGSATISLTSNGNNLYAPNGNVGYHGANRVTLADWRTASSQDATSVSANPQYVNLATGNLQPSSGALNNIGVAVTPAVTDDITGAARPATPDPGAYEFTPAPNDVGVIAITSPTSGCNLTASENIVITIQNFGTATQSNFPISYTINGGTPVTQTFAGPLAPGATATVTFTVPANLATPNTYNIVAQTNLTGDALTANNATTKVVTAIPSISTLPYTEGFENGNGGWIAGGTNSSWAIGTPAKAVINSAGAGSNSYVTGLTGTYNASENSHVTSPCFNFTGLGDPDFEMKVWWNSEGGWDGAVLQSSIDGGTTWANVGALNDPNNWYNDASLDGRAGGQDIGWAGTGTASSGGWVTAKHKLTGLGGQSSVQLRIAFGSDASVHYDGFAFDDIRIGDNTNNLAITSFVPLTQLCGFGTNEKVEVVLENLGGLPVTGYTVSYTVNGGAAVTAPGPALAPGVPTNFVFPTGANLSAAGTYTIVVTVTNPGDPEAGNNTVTYTISNATFPGLPPVFNFETPTTGIAALRTVTRTKSAITESAAASRPLIGAPATSTKGMLMEATTATGWVMPVGITDPWTNNPDFFSAAYICFTPPTGTSPLWLSFDLKQTFNTANANTNFRVTVNGTPVGGNQTSPANTYRPPFNGVGGTSDWTKIYLDLTAYTGGNIQIGLESSVGAPFAAGAGPANMVDNIRFHSSNPTGMKDNALAQSLSVYPNPSNGMFTVSLPKGKTFEMEVTDLTGKVVMKQVVKGNAAQLDLKGQAQGVYMLKITSEGNTAVQKLIIQ